MVPVRRPAEDAQAHRFLAQAWCFSARARRSGQPLDRPARRGAVFAALIGWLMLGERPGVVPVILMALVATGAVMVEFWG